MSAVSLTYRMAFVALLVLFSVPSAVMGDEAWVETPYRAVIWLAMPSDAETHDLWADRLPAKLLDRCKSHFGAALRCEVSAPPSAVVESTLNGDEVPLDLVGSPDDPIWKKDKLFLVVVQRRPGGVDVSVRELDCRTRLWGPAKESSGVQLERLDRAIAAAIFDVFRCLGRISHIEKNSATLEMRAGLLAGLSQAQTIPNPGSIFHPVIRRVDRRGVAAADGAAVVPWTLLQVQSADEDASSKSISAAKVRCRVDSGFRSPFRARTVRRVERLGLFVTPMHDHTVFELRTRGNPVQPLLGYEVHARLPGAKTMTYVGRSGWDGNVVVPRDEHPYKIYYIKHGDVLLAKLPCAAGLKPRVTVELADHSERLRAEGFINGIEDELLDLVIRREISAAKLHQQIDKELVTESDITKANELHTEVRRINRSDELLEALQREEAKFSSQDRAVQSRIDRMFARTRKSIRDTIQGSYVIDLRNAIDRAKLRVRQ